MGWDGNRKEGIEHDERGWRWLIWGKVGRDGKGWHRREGKGRKGMGCEGMGWEGKRRDLMGWGGMGSDGVGWDGMWVGLVQHCVCWGLVWLSSV